MGGEWGTERIRKVSLTKEMMSLRKTCTLVLLFLVLSMTNDPLPAWGQPLEGAQKLQVVGTGKIRRDNVASARDEAIEHGLWDAVEQETQLLLSPDAVVSHFQPLNTQIFSQPEAFIQDYRVLTESKVGRSYRVVLEATVFVEALRDKLERMGILATDKDLPQVVLLLSEKNVDQTYPRRTWDHETFMDLPLTVEAALTRALEERGFVVLNADLAPDGEAADDRFLGASPTDDMALTWAEQVGADVAILGQATAQRTGNLSGTGMQSVEARLSLRTFRLDNRESIGVFEATNAAVHEDEQIAGTKALGLTVSGITTELIRQVTANWRGETRETTLVKLFVKGIEEYADFVRLRRTIRDDVTGTRNVYLRAIRTGEAQLDVELQGTARVLAEELVLKNFEGFGINVLEVGPDSIRLDLIPKEEISDNRQQPMETDLQDW